MMMDKFSNKVAPSMGAGTVKGDIRAMAQCPSGTIAWAFVPFAGGPAGVGKVRPTMLLGSRVKGGQAVFTVAPITSQKTAPSDRRAGDLVFQLGSGFASGTGLDKTAKAMLDEAIEITEDAFRGYLGKIDLGNPVLGRSLVAAIKGARRSAWIVERLS
jgi:hypothetical protein